MTAARVAFPSHCTLEDTLRALDASGAIAPDVTEVELALGERWFFDAGALAVVGAWGEHRAAQGVRFSVSGAPDARDYLARMNLFHRIGVPYEEQFQRRVEAGRFVPLTSVEGSSGHATNLLCDLVVQHFDNARDFLPAFE